MIISPERLRALTEGLVAALGTPADLAQIVAEGLVEANLAGHDSHGVLRLPWYARQIRDGRIRPAARPELLSVSGATARVDGHLGWGPPAAWLATEAALDRARACGVGAATLLRGNHIGRVGAYVERLARAGMVGMALCNASPAVAPFGGTGRLLGTNPFAMAAPGDPPMVLDFATSAVAEGKLRVAVAAGQQVGPGLLRDAAGRPTQDPRDFYAGGALETFGLHKGSGMSVMIELLARGLAGVDHTAPEPGGFNGTLILALDVGSFVPPELFVAAAERLAAQVAARPPIEGVGRVLLPGEPERLVRKQRLAEGIPLAEPIWAELCQLARELGVAV